MTDRFIGEPIKPITSAGDTAPMAIGAPATPRRFRWRNRIVVVSQVVKTWKETGPRRYDSGERYLRKHWFAVCTKTGENMKIYFDRTPRTGRNNNRWWLFSISRSADASPHDTA